MAEMREIYSNTLIELANNDERIVVVEADLMHANGTSSFQDSFPDRIFNVGVAEANMIGIASGLSAMGKIPFANTFASFAARRDYDQFFLSANYARLNVKLIGTDPGICAAFNGGTHMPFEDIGLMRLIPGCTVIEPSDGISLRSLLHQITYDAKCTYIRINRKTSPTIYIEEDIFELGKGKIICEGSDVTIIATGSIMVPEALKAVENLKREGISAGLIDLHTIKPLDTELILEYAEKTKKIVTCENHQIIGGIGSAIAEFLSENYPIPIKRIGIKDRFGQVGDIEYLKKEYELNSGTIEKATKSLLAN